MSAPRSFGLCSEALLPEADLKLRFDEDDGRQTGLFVRDSEFSVAMDEVNYTATGLLIVMGK